MNWSVVYILVFDVVSCHTILYDKIDISIFCFFFFKQKTAYEIVSRDWSSDVCSSDLTFHCIY